MASYLKCSHDKNHHLRSIYSASGIAFHALSTFPYLISTINICGLSYYCHSTNKNPRLRQRFGNLPEISKLVNGQSWNSNLSLSDTRIWVLNYWTIPFLKSKVSTQNYTTHKQLYTYTCIHSSTVDSWIMWGLGTLLPGSHREKCQSNFWHPHKLNY